MATNTAASSITYTGDGSTSNFSISFSFISNIEIDVFVGGVLKTINTHYTVSGSTVTFTSGNIPSNGTSIKFQRNTDLSAKKVDFQDGSVLTEKDLDTNSDQVLFGLQEFVDEINNNVIKRDGTQTITNNLVFEGSSDDANETTLGVVNPTADRTINLPNVSGTVVTTGDTGTVSNSMIDDNAVNAAKISEADLKSLSNCQTGSAASLANLTNNEVLILNGATVSATELNTLDGVNSTLTASELNTLDGITASTANLNQLTGKEVETSVTTNSNAKIPTSKAVNDLVLAVTNALGGFVAIADKTSFPTSHPDPSENAGTVVSLTDANGIVVNSSGVATISNGAGSSTVTINGFPTDLRSRTLGSGIGLQVQTTTTLHTYDYHKALIKESDLVNFSADVDSFRSRYRVVSTTPTSDNDEGDIIYRTSDDKLLIYNGTAFQDPLIGNFHINTLSSYNGTGGNTATFNGSAYRFNINHAPEQAQQLLVSINGVIQKPNSGTSQPSEGFALNGDSIIFGAAPASGSDFFIITIGKSVNIGVVSDGTITDAKVASDASIEGTKINPNFGSQNIITSGTVDGRDVSADGAKLDGIEANAINASNTAITNKLPLAGGTLTGNLTINTTAPLITFNESDTSKIFNLVLDGSALSIRKDSNAGSNIVQRWNSDGHVDFLTNVDFASGIDVTGNITLVDNGKIILGDGGETDSFISFDGQHLQIRETSPTGALLVDGHNIFLRNPTQNDEKYLFCNGGSTGRNVELYCQGTKRLETTSTGLDVTGNLVATGNEHKFTAGTSGDLTLVLQADSDNNNEGDNPKLLFRQDGTLDEGAIFMLSNTLNIASSVSAGGGINLRTSNTNSGYATATKRMEISPAGQITMHGNVDCNSGLDVTGDTTTTQFFGAGTTSPATKFHSFSDNTHVGHQIRISQSGTGDAVLGWELTNVRAWSAGIDNSDSNRWKLSSGSSVDSNTQITIEQDGFVGLHHDSATNPKLKTTSYGITVNDGDSGFTGTYNARVAAVIESSNSAGTVLNIMSPASGYSGIFFGRNGSATRGQIHYQHNAITGVPANSWRFINDGSVETMLINSTSIDLKKPVNVTGAITATASAANTDILTLTTHNSRTLNFTTPNGDSGSLPFVISTSNAIEFKIDNQSTLFIDDSGQVNLHHDGSSTAKLFTDATGISVNGTLNISQSGSNNTAGLKILDSNNSGAAPFIEVIGKRSDGNDSQCFSGKVHLAIHRTNAKIDNGKVLGTVAFGGNHTDDSISNILYSASISGVASDSFDSATDMPTDLVFFTGSTGRSQGQANVTTGDERMRITATGNLAVDTDTLFVDSTNDRVGINFASPDNALDVAGMIRSYSTSGGQGTSGLRIGTATENFDMFFGAGTANSQFSFTYGGSGGADIVVTHDGIVKLFNGGGTTPKLATTATGVDVDGRINISSSVNTLLTLTSTTRHCGFSMIDSNGSSALQNRDGNIRFLAGGDASGSGASDVLFINGSLGRVGIGTTSVGATLHLSSTLPELRFTDTDNNNIDHFISCSGSAMTLKADESQEDNAGDTTIRFHIDTVEKGRFDDAGLDVTGNIQMAGTGNILIPDRTSSGVNELRLGNEADYRIYHNGTNAVMDNLTGNFFIKSVDDINFQNRTNNEIMAKFRDDDACELYFDGGTYSTPKLKTTATGVQVNGNLDIDTGTLIIDTNADSPNTSYGLQEAIRIDDAGSNLDRGLHIYEYRQGGMRFHSLNYNLASSSTGSAYQYTQGNYANSSMLRFDGTFKFYADAEVTAGSQDVITPTERFRVDTDGADVFGNLYITSAIPQIFLTDTGDNPDYVIQNNNGQFRIYDSTNNASRLTLTATGLGVPSTITCTSLTETSDIALKENIQPLSNVLDKVKQLTGYRYNFKDNEKASMGVIAQDVEKVFPELVHGEEGEKSLQYSGLVGALIEAVKELSAKVAALESS